MGALGRGRSHSGEHCTIVYPAKVSQAQLLPLAQPWVYRGVREGFLEEGACGRESAGVQEAWRELWLGDK